jgi:hypothetical protein
MSIHRPLAVPPFLRRFLLMTEASDPHSDNKDSHADNTKLSELITTQEAQEGELRKRDKSLTSHQHCVRERAWVMTYQTRSQRYYLLGTCGYAKHYQH